MSRDHSQNHYGPNASFDGHDSDLAAAGILIESLRQQLEIERMRNVACDVVAMADTPTSAEEARKMLPDYRSAALESVIRRVDECIALRQQLADKQAIIDDWLYANGPNGWIESLRQQLSESQAELNEFRKNAKVGFDRQLRDQQKLETSQKREVMLREALETCEVGDFSTGHVIYPSFDEKLVNEALAATDDLDGLILCHAEPGAWNETITGRLATSDDQHRLRFPMCYEPLYRAWEPK